jgi:modulator of FtsH protease
MFQSQSPRYQAPAFGATNVATGALLGQVLGITGVGFLITAVAAYLVRDVPYGVSLIAGLVGFVPLIALNFTRANQPLSLALFYAFAAIEGVAIGPIVANYARVDGPATVVNAASTTGLGMLTLAAVVYLTSFDYRKLAGWAFAALIVLIIAGFVSIFWHFMSPTAYSWLTLIVFSVLVLVDFARIRAGGSGATAVQLATSIYLDAINIFLALLRIFGGRGRD